MTSEDAHRWLDGTYDEQTYFNDVYVNKLSYRASELSAQLALGVAAKMKQALCVLQYEETK